jgi:iron complex outermembrane receptor protein
MITHRTASYRALKQSLAAGVAGLAMIPACAMAQDATTPQNTPSAASAEAAQSGSQMEEIVVTAQRRSESLQNIPASISAFSGAQLEKRNVVSAQDLAKITPGLTFAASTFTPQPTIRGIGSRGLSAGEESSVPIYIDGVYQTNMVSTGFKLNSVERIEVLKGPQGALYGRNSTGGAINVITRDPPTAPRADFLLSYGSYNELVGKAYVGGGIGTLSADVAFVGYRTDGYFHDVKTDSTRGGYRNYDVRSKVLWRPSDKFRLTIVGDHSYSLDNTSQMSVPVDGNSSGYRYTPAPPMLVNHYDVDRGHDSPFRYTQSSIAATAVVDFGWAQLTALTSFVHGRQFMTNNNGSGTSAPIYVGAITLVNNANYNEAYLATAGDKPFRLIVGGVYYTNDSRYDNFNITTMNPLTLAATRTTHNNRALADSISGYVQASYDLTDKLTITAGGRVTSEKATFQVINYVSGSATAPPAPINRAGSKRWEPFVPSGNISYRPNADLTLFAKVGRGFKSGIFSGSSSNIVPADPEYITQYELGAKAKLAPWLRTNLSLFHSDYTNMQVNSRDPVTNANVLQNASSAKINGLEFELGATPNSQSNLQIGLAYTRGRYSSFPNAQVTIPITTVDPAANSCASGTGTPLGGNRTVFCDVSGKTLLRTPEVTGNIAGDYSWPLVGGTFTVGGNVSYQSSFYWDAFNRLRAPARVLIDGELSWTTSDKSLKISGRVQNLTNEYYFESLTTSALADIAYAGRPRTFVFQISKSFK